MRPSRASIPLREGRNLLRPLTGKDDSALQSEGYIDIDATGGLVAAHDAATAHLGSPWRMPTDEEYGDLINNCDLTWTTKNGVNGYEVRGRGEYASNSIFLPEAGAGYNSYFIYPGSYGYYWPSTLYGSDYACCLYFGSDSFDYFDLSGCYRYDGQSVRPVRDAD